MSDVEEVRFNAIAVQVQVALSDALNRRVDVDVFRDASLRAIIYNFRTYIAQNRQWEETRTIPMKISWRQRIHAPFGGEIPTTLRVSVYRNCPHLPVDDMGRHAMFIAPPMTVTAAPREVGE